MLEISNKQGDAGGSAGRGSKGDTSGSASQGTGVDGDAGSSAALWLSFLVGYPVKGQAGGITGQVA